MTVMTLTANAFESILKCLQLYPQGDILLIGFRGMTGGLPYAQWHPTITLQESQPDFLTLQCTLALYHRRDKRFALFKGSTYPHLFFLEKQWQSPQKKIANILSEGMYRYIVGAHEPGENSHAPLPKEEGAFRLSRHQPVPVWRFLSKTAWHEKAPTLDLSYPGDNLHAAQSTKKRHQLSFSSAGCQVVEGDHVPPDLPTGHYQAFRLMAGQTENPHIENPFYGYSLGQSYDYLLLSFRTLKKIKEEKDKLWYLHGSRGLKVRKLQERLITSNLLEEETIDKGVFNGATSMAFDRFQKTKNLGADIIIDEDTLEQLSSP